MHNGFSAWIALGLAAAALLPAGGAAQNDAGGSTVPCEVPLRWRVARVDRDFGMEPDRAMELVREAASWWDAATGAALFEEAPRDGFPIRFVFDERQARLLEREAVQRQLEASAADLAAARDALDTRNAALQTGQSEHRDRFTDYERALTEYNDEVRAWNGRGGAPPEVVVALTARERELQDRGRGLEREGEALRRTFEALQADQRAFNDRVAAHSRRSDEVSRNLALGSVQSGEYREMVQREGARVVSVGREIRVYRFADEADLRLVVAHEMGHALGLGHIEAEGAVMNEEHVRSTDASIPTALAEADIRRLRALCPTLPGDAP